MSRFRPRLTFANVVSLLALFVALGGGAFAAASFVGSDGRIHGCVAKDGTLTLTKPGKGCPKHRARIAWNQKGKQGAPGLDGAAVAVRVRATGAVHTPADHSYASVPLASSKWSQRPGELDIGPFGRMTFTDPPSGSCGGVGLADISFEIDVDGRSLFATSLPAVPDGKQRTTTIVGTQGILFEPAAATTHTATAKVASGCESGNFPADFTVTALRFDFVRAR